MASSTRVDPNPNKIYVDRGLALINKYINDYKSSSVPLSNDSIYKIIEGNLSPSQKTTSLFMNQVDLTFLVDKNND
jgi:archaellum component FlaG (FlaF/FlaG flagellin family)